MGGALVGWLPVMRFATVVPLCALLLLSKGAYA